MSTEVTTSWDWTAAVLDWSGAAITLVGIVFVAVYVYREWESTAAPGAVFIRNPTLRRLLRRSPPRVEVDAAFDGISVTMTATVEAHPPSREGEPLDERIRALEGELVDLRNDFMNRAMKTDGKLQELALADERAARDVASRFDGLKVTQSYEASQDLHNAGWALIWSAFGLLLQIAGSVVSFFLGS